MNRDCTVTAALKRAQITMFREAKRIGITASVIHYDTGGDHGGISLSTIGQWSRGESAMGLEMVIRLIGVIPNNLLSLLLPDGHQIVRAPDAIDHDALCEWATDFVTAKNAAHHPASECGRDLGPKETELLTGKVAAFPVKAAA